MGVEQVPKVLYMDDGVIKCGKNEQTENYLHTEKLWQIIWLINEINLAKKSLKELKYAKVRKIKRCIFISSLINVTSKEQIIWVLHYLVQYTHIEWTLHSSCEDLQYCGWERLHRNVLFVRHKGEQMRRGHSVFVVRYLVMISIQCMLYIFC